MFRRMLVPLDGTRVSASIVPYAVELAKRLDCEVYVVLVEPHDKPRLPHPEHHQPRAVPRPGDKANRASPIRDANERYVARFLAEFEEAGVPATGQVRCGEPVDEILRAALDFRSDVIAMATLNRARFSHRDGVSVTQNVLWRSRLPVFLIGEG